MTLFKIGAYFKEKPYYVLTFSTKKRKRFINKKKFVLTAKEQYKQSISNLDKLQT